MSVEALYTTAHNAGMEAGMNHNPVPMMVGTAKSLFDNSIDDSKPVYRVNSGVCGFAWVSIRPARGKLVNWLKKNGIGRKNNYEGGYQISVFEFGQSMEQKEAYARAFAKVLRENGIDAYAGSRMD
jgi:hypothetical protein